MPLEAGGYPIYPDERDYRYPPEGVFAMTPQEHLAEIARLADEMRPHMDAIGAVLIVRVFPAYYTSPIEVQLNKTKDVLALVPGACVSENDNGEPYRHCRTQIGNITISGCEPIGEEVTADV
jgi:hypothetical protein